MTIKQLTVLTGNSAAHLSTILTYLSDEGVNIRAHCLVDNGDGNCKLRMIVSQPDQAVDILLRNRLARELHDTLAHSLSAVTVQLEAVRSLWQSDPGAARALLDQADQTIRKGGRRPSRSPAPPLRWSRTALPRR